MPAVHRTKHGTAFGRAINEPLPPSGRGRREASFRHTHDGNFRGAGLGLAPPRRCKRPTQRRRQHGPPSAGKHKHDAKPKQEARPPASVTQTTITADGISSQVRATLRGEKKALAAAFWGSVVRGAALTETFLGAKSSGDASAPLEKARQPRGVSDVSRGARPNTRLRRPAAYGRNIGDGRRK